jgi:hypothetical protein
MSRRCRGVPRAPGARRGKWFDQLAAEPLAVDYIASAIRSTGISFPYQLFIQLELPAVQLERHGDGRLLRYITTQRRVDWFSSCAVGEFDGFPMWPWFHDFMGGIRWKDYIPKFARRCGRQNVMKVCRRRS